MRASGQVEVRLDDPRLMKLPAALRADGRAILSEADEEKRAALAEALARKDAVGALDFLLALLETDTSADVREDIVERAGERERSARRAGPRAARARRSRSGSRARRPGAVAVQADHAAHAAARTAGSRASGRRLDRPTRSAGSSPNRSAGPRSCAAACCRPSFKHRRRYFRSNRRISRCECSRSGTTGTAAGRRCASRRPCCSPTRRSPSTSRSPWGTTSIRRA